MRIADADSIGLVVVETQGRRTDLLPVRRALVTAAREGEMKLPLAAAFVDLSPVPLRLQV